MKVPGRLIKNNDYSEVALDSTDFFSIIALINCLSSDIGLWRHIAVRMRQEKIYSIVDLCFQFNRSTVLVKLGPAQSLFYLMKLEYNYGKGYY